MVPFMTLDVCPVYLIALSRLSGHLNEQNKPKLKYKLKQHFPYRHAGDLKLHWCLSKI